MRIRIANGKLPAFYFLAALLPALPPTRVVMADTLELRTGQIVQGRFLGGSTKNIRFQVNGQEQVFATQDLLNIGFSEPAADAPNVVPESPVAGTASSPDPQPTQPPRTQPNLPPATSPPVPKGTPSTVVPAGTTIFVRMIDGVDSSQNRIGDTFRASLESTLVVGDTVVAPKGADPTASSSKPRQRAAFRAAPN